MEDVGRSELAPTEQGAQAVTEARLEQPTVASPAEVAPESKPAATPVVDLDQVPQFREWKSRMDRQVAEKDQQLGASRAELQRMYREQYDLATSGMDQNERAKYDLQLTQAQLGQLQQQQEAQSQRQHAVYERELFVGRTLKSAGLSRQEVPPDRYQNREDWLEAVVKTVERKARASAGGPAGAQARREASTVDTGAAPSPGGELGRLQERRKKLLNSGNVFAAMEIDREILSITSG